MLKAINLRVEYKTNPLGMDETAPRFSYQLTGTSKAQSAYRIVVECEDGSQVWDSGFVQSGENIQIVYQGIMLRRFTTYNWKVKVKDEKGAESDWSKEEAFFETGFMNSAWKGKWITGRTYTANLTGPQRCAKDFVVEGKVKKARLYITALGLYEAYINGKPVTENCFMPGWTQYYDRVQYQVYDIKHLLNKGGNALAASLGTGWFSGRIATNNGRLKTSSLEHTMSRAEIINKIEIG